MTDEPSDKPDDSDEPIEFDAQAAVRELDEAMKRADQKQQGHDNPGSSEYVAILEDEIAKLNSALEAERAKLFKAKEATAKESERADRAQGEVERAKKRVQADANVAIEQKKRKFLISIVELLDDLRRSIAAANQESAHSPLLDGVERVEKKFHAFLTQHGVAPIGEQVGDEFDPNIHEALSTAQAPTPEANNTILNVYEAGFMIGSEVLRPARVIVGKYQG